MRYERVPPVPRRLNARGQLVLLGNYRWDPTLAGASIAKLTHMARGYFNDAPYGSYRWACANDELDRRLPRTASLCYDVRKGWEPLTEEAERANL